jgi:hypothetical protein
LSFDVFAQAFRNGCIGIADDVAARAILSEYTHKHDAEYDFYNVEFADGYHLELFAGGFDGKKPFDGGMFVLRGISDAVGDFMFRFTRASGCVLMPAMQPVCVLLTQENQEQHLPSGMRDDFQVITISSGAELLAALEGGYDTWRAYRDRIIGAATDGT